MDLSIHQAISSRLSTDAQLTGMISGVFDWVQGAQPFPYITIGENATEAWDTDTSHGLSVSFAVKVWSQAQGYTQAKEIQRRVWQLLHDQPLVIADGNVVQILQENSEMMWDASSATVMGTQRFRLLVEMT